MKLSIFVSSILLLAAQVSEAANHDRYNCTDGSSSLTLTVQRSGTGALEYYTESHQDYAFGFGSAECGVNRMNRKTGHVLLSCWTDSSGINRSRFAYWLQLPTEAPAFEAMTIRAGVNLRDLENWDCRRI